MLLPNNVVRECVTCDSRTKPSDSHLVLDLLALGLPDQRQRPGGGGDLHHAHHHGHPGDALHREARHRPGGPLGVVPGAQSATTGQGRGHPSRQDRFGHHQLHPAGWLLRGTNDMPGLRSSLMAQSRPRCVTPCHPWHIVFCQSGPPCCSINWNSPIDNTAKKP